MAVEGFMNMNMNKVKVQESQGFRGILGMGDGVN